MIIKKMTEQEMAQATKDEQLKVAEVAYNFYIGNLMGFQGELDEHAWYIPFHKLTEQEKQAWIKVVRIVAVYCHDVASDEGYIILDKDDLPFMNDGELIEPGIWEYAAWSKVTRDTEE